ncbi:Hsp20/alpha crystallin family protein [Arthrobacter sp. 35W]|uniref:Hsp20/alpha crystallin family protein n=1 Tax=Arthrobacter sp. 35W TaxID=1132441 RepID=UPI000416BA31|nr:Hsp20/alpha crystallin family protein [Arthrobacter sp. 35W]
MGGFGHMDRFELPESLRRLFEADWESPKLRVEEYRDGETMVVRAELPGIDPDRDADVSINNGILTIKVERREDAKRKEAGGYRSEFRYGSVSRNISLPPGIREEDIKASYQDGILEIRIPAPPAGETTSSKVRIDRG